MRATHILMLAIATTLACDARTTATPQAPKPPEAPKAEAPKTEPFRAPKLPGITEPDAKLTTALRAEIAKKPRGYKPRTHHLEPDGAPIHVNRLIRETSPYLLQHAHNPVNWYAWGEEAFAHAKALGRPVLLSIGYSTCHWCHVMERESFEDEEIAAFLNQHFITIKVDREERPDLDDVYMRAVQLLTGRGGWPMTVVLTPDREPFFGGTYFPARDGDRGAHKGFLTILGELKDQYGSTPDEVVKKAKNLSARMARGAAPGRPGRLPGPEAILGAASALNRRFDPMFGGFGRAPKFPTPGNLDMLLHHARRTNDPQALRMVTVTLDRIARGGIHDHVGGGFHRYSVDARWLVPHFEKMLYDNAQLAGLYLDAHVLTGERRYADVARKTLDYALREMMSPEGAFYSATDADSMTPNGHLEEGYYFTWTPAELERILDVPERTALTTLHPVTPKGNFEGRTILHVPKPVEVDRALLQRAYDKLYEARSARPAPLRDDKFLVSWNALMISALARAGWTLGEARYTGAAKKAADFLWDNVRTPGGVLQRTYNQGQAKGLGYLEDHAYLIRALLDLFEVTSETVHLERALALQRALDAKFWDHKSGGYFTTGTHHEALLTRDKPSYDGAEPSGNAIAASNLLRLASLTTDHAWHKRAQELLEAFALSMMRPGGTNWMLSALDWELDDAREVVIVTPQGADDAALLEVVRTTYHPNMVFTRVTPGPQQEAIAKLVPYVKGKPARKGRPTAYVCQQGRCELPTSDPKTFRAQLTRIKPLGSASQPLPTR